MHKENGEFIHDTINWDVKWPLNNPEQFAINYWNDLDLNPSYQKQVAFSIRKQIFDHLKQINSNKKYNLLSSLDIPVNKATLNIDNKISIKKNTDERSDNNDNSVVDETHK